MQENISLDTKKSALLIRQFNPFGTVAPIVDTGSRLSSRSAQLVNKPFQRIKVFNDTLAPNRGTRILSQKAYFPLPRLDRVISGKDDQRPSHFPSIGE